MYARLTATDVSTKIEGPLLFLKKTVDVGFNEAVEVEGNDGKVRLARVATISDDTIMLEVLDNTAGLSLKGTRIRFFGQPLEFSAGPGIQGRVFNGVGKLIDGGPPIAAQQSMLIEGLPIKPVARRAPSEYLETGVSSIDLMNSLIRGQKLPLFSAGGLPHDRIAMDIVNHAQLPGSEEGDFAIVFGGIVAKQAKVL